MDELTQPDTTTPATTTEEVSIFDDLKPLPVYYTARAIYIFSALMGVLFGSVLMAMNLKKAGSEKGVGLVIGYGVLFTAFQYYLIYVVLKSNSGITIGVNMVGAAIMNKLFWEKYIGKDVRFTPRSVLVPAIIAVALLLLFLIPVFMK